MKIGPNHYLIDKRLYKASTTEQAFDSVLLEPHRRFALYHDKPVYGNLYLSPVYEASSLIGYNVCFDMNGTFLVSDDKRHIPGLLILTHDAWENYFTTLYANLAKAFEEQYVELRRWSDATFAIATQDDAVEVVAKCLGMNPYDLRTQEEARRAEEDR